MKLIKHDSEDNSYLSILNKCCYFELINIIYLIYIELWQYYWGGIIVSTKIWVRTTIFNIDNKKCLLSSKSAYQRDFWRIMWHWSNDAKNSALHRRNKLHYFELIILSNIVYFTVFLIKSKFWNKRRMSETEPKLSAWLLFIIQYIPDKKQQQLSSYISFIEETISIWNTSHHESKMLYEHCLMSTLRV